MFRIEVYYKDGYFEFYDNVTAECWYNYLFSALLNDSEVEKINVYKEDEEKDD